MVPDAYGYSDDGDDAAPMLLIILLRRLIFSLRNKKLYAEQKSQPRLYAAQKSRQAKKRRRCFCFAMVSLELTYIGWDPIVEDNPEESSSAATDVDIASVGSFESTMAGLHSESVGLFQ